MCSRFEISAPIGLLVARFALMTPPSLVPGPVIKPTDSALVITRDGPQLRRFGLTVSWDPRPLLNGRLESLDQRSSFKPLLGNRCLVPATAWFEWQKIDGQPRKTPWRLGPEILGLFALAGLMTGEEFLLLTCAAAPAIARLHDRMPVILPRSQEQRWLDPTESFAELSSQLGPHDGSIKMEPADQASRAIPFQRNLDLFR